MFGIYFIGFLLFLLYYSFLQVELHSRQYAYFKKISDDIARRLAGIGEYVFDFDLEHTTYEAFASFDSCLAMCQHFMKNPSCKGRLEKAFRDKIFIKGLSDYYWSEFTNYDFCVSDQDRMEHCAWMPKLVWEWAERVLINRCRPKFHKEVAARFTWRFGRFRKEVFEYNEDALIHMMEWCDARQGRLAASTSRSCKNLPNKC